MPESILKELVVKELANLDWSIKYHEEKLVEAKDRRDELLAATEGLPTED